MIQKTIKTICLILLLSMPAGIYSQELNCNIQVNSEQIQGSNKAVFAALQKSTNEFINNRKWTEASYSLSEKIECSMNIIVKKHEGDLISAEIQVQSRRPVYNSGYNTTIFNFKDNNFSFTFKEFDQLEMNENTITSNLTAVLAYYAYIIIGLDMDSYSRFGGSIYFQAAEQIVNMAQSADLAGWKAFESTRNRYALISNLTDEAFKKFRSYFYDYHRLGLDEMTLNMTNARAKIAEGIPILRETNRSRPSAIVIASFLDAKTDEILNIFSNGTAKEKALVSEILNDVNPTQSEKYAKMLK